MFTHTQLHETQEMLEPFIWTREMGQRMPQGKYERAGLWLYEHEATTIRMRTLLRFPSTDPGEIVTSRAGKGGR